MEIYTKDELNDILASHKLWIDTAGKQGEQADLRFADLRFADLRYADLRNADLRSADLRYADLRYADLHYANLREANLDFSCGFSLSCRGTRFTASVKLAYQYLAHLCTIIPAEGEEKELQSIKDAILPFAKKSHRAKELGLIDDE